MKNIKVIAFDVDGTILNTDEIYFNILKKQLLEEGVCLSKKFYGKYGLDDSLYSLNLDPILTKSVKQKVTHDYYHNDQLANIKLKTGVFETIQTLSRDYQLAIASGEKLGRIKKYLTYFNLEHYIDFIAHGELVEGRKDNPEYFLRIANYYGVTPQECLMIGDSVTDLKATEVGFQTLIIPTEFTQHATWSNDVIFLNSADEIPRYLKDKIVKS
ncbi:MAG: HAD-IA family hydrolase [Candidatus Gracilibacteria bacterium]|nr:HAD-IA family hydrolase [Candidatus Gracilibacteria bacterium]